MTKILIIEDDKDLRADITELLNANSYETISAAGGIEAMEKIKEGIPDLVLSDIMMPEMDGYEVLNMFQNNDSTAAVPFIFISAKVESEDIRKGMNCGADDYLTKPFRAKDLLAAVEAKLKKKKLTDDIMNRLTIDLSLFMPHELRTPLVSILGFSEILLDNAVGIKEEEARDMLQRINGSGKRLHKIIEKFLIYAQLLIQTDGRLPVKDDGPADTEELLRQIVSCEGKDRADDISLMLEGAVLNIPEHHLKFLFEEIIGNSIKFTKKGTVIRVSSGINKGGYVFEVLDYGYGISDEVFENIKTCVAGSHNILKVKRPGLGLCLAGKIAGYYGGKLKIESRHLMYTRATVTLPVKQNICQPTQQN